MRHTQLYQCIGALIRSCLLPLHVVTIWEWGCRLPTSVETGSPAHRPCEYSSFSTALINTGIAPYCFLFTRACGVHHYTREPGGGSAMSLSDQEPQPKRAYPSDEAALVVPLDAVDRTSLLVVGGKAANLGELIKAGFPVPAGFCVTTAAYALHSERAGLN